eukprot:CAMPEP_0205911444 /NCGR_PEP_ID=MMETSP1325-20131115/5155_1 /ASSEMBLY_ACC=CAM_ASM_000708 /TAXON_ID=236786 /ORGANISM="Florenciella sp., Strain RCC1007" /LENGTH=250 /DNA_ID=CAMNT_0053277975 /DNA_START=420 /DNA_END=1172 /DNA_ORIENTATION=-
MKGGVSLMQRNWSRLTHETPSFSRASHNKARAAVLLTWICTMRPGGSIHGVSSPSGWSSRWSLIISAASSEIVSCFDGQAVSAPEGHASTAASTKWWPELSSHHAQHPASWQLAEPEAGGLPQPPGHKHRRQQPQQPLLSFFMAASARSLAERNDVSTNSAKISILESLQVASTASMSSRRYSMVRTDSRGITSSPKQSDVMYASVFAAASGDRVPPGGLIVCVCVRVCACVRVCVSDVPDGEGVEALAE